MEVDLKSFNNDWYHAGSFFKRTLWFILGRIFINTYLPFPMAFKIEILKLFGAKIGEGLVIKPKVNIKYPWFLEIKDHVWIGEEVWIDNYLTVILGNNCCISQGAMLLTGNHNYKNPSFDLMINGIELKDGSWVGAKTVVCPGVVLEKNSVLTVGSIATKKLDENSIFQGNPAKFLRKRF